jgi:membrane peptidoglycan carboxypeptidase
VRSALVLATFFITFGLGLAYAGWALVCRGDECPSIDILEDYTPRQTSKLYAADGRFIAEIGLERRTLVPLRDIPVVVRQAFQITEDKRFYQHAGIDWIRVFGAGLHNIRSGGYGQGFSTLTMQLARNVFPERISREKTLVRKLKEAKVARAIEAKYSKDKILELYLNQIYLGNGAYGVETAAQRYFGKSVRDLNLAEAATLAALPKAPERYNPRRSRPAMPLLELDLLLQRRAVAARHQVADVLAVARTWIGVVTAWREQIRADRRHQIPGRPCRSHPEAAGARSRQLSCAGREGVAWTEVDRRLSSRLGAGLVKEVRR